MSADAFKPLVISMGDPCGIGPEIIVRWWASQATAYAPVWVAGEQRAFERAIKALDQSMQCHVFSDLHEITQYALHHSVKADTLWLLDDKPYQDEPLPAFGVISPVAGKMAVAAVQHAAQACLQQHARAMVTAPLHKEAMRQAGYPWPGHTEMLQAWSAAHFNRSIQEMPVQMMLANAEVATVLLSTHVALQKAIEQVTQQKVFEAIMQIYQHWPDRQAASRLRVGVGALNPHAGEQGQFGKEEEHHISPAVLQAQALGYAVSGPWPADTVFRQAKQGEFDVVLSMTHDLGLIPIKYEGFDEGVNMTLGLPFIRTSPDHGTAFAIAGKAIASEKGLSSAVKWAQRYAGASDF